MDDHAVCEAIRAGKEVTGRDLQRAEERGLVEKHQLTVKGIALLDGIEPTACSGWHMGGMAVSGDWQAERRKRRRK